MNSCPCISCVTFDCGVEKIDLRYMQQTSCITRDHSKVSCENFLNSSENSRVIPVSSTQNPCEFGGFVEWKKWNIHTGYLKIRSFPTIVLYMNVVYAHKGLTMEIKFYSINVVIKRNRPAQCPSWAYITGRDAPLPFSCAPLCPFCLPWRPALLSNGVPALFVSRDALPFCQLECPLSVSIID